MPEPLPPPPQPIEIAGRTLSFDRPILMGVVNVTPDSFSDGGRYLNHDTAVSQAAALLNAGAEIIDVGGESTRPGAAPVTEQAELSRVIPVIEALARCTPGAWISIDTSKSAVARAALAAGASIVNDVTALSDPNMAPLIASAGAALVVMHMRGEPRTMQRGEIVYDDLVGEIADHLARAVQRAVAAGIARERVMIDPGIGFGKTVAHNLTITRHLGALARSGQPVVYGPSRKSFLGAITGHPPADRDRATAAACVAAVLAGAHVLRIHDAAAVADAIAVATAIRDAD